MKHLMNGNNRRIVVQERDIHLLQELSVIRVVDREQAKTVAGFSSTTRVNARLLTLTRAGLLRRFSLGMGGTRAKAIYAHSVKGAARAGVPFRGLRRKADEALVADFFVEHQLAINEVYCAVKYGTPIPGVAFRRWMTFDQPVSPAVRLIPDGYFEFATAKGTLAAFLEADRGHERGPVWKEKTRHYLELAASGAFAERFRQERFRVLVVVNSERRMACLRKTVAAITPKLFWFATFAAISKAGLFAAPWYRPVGEGPKPFIDEPP
jgi:hypothetical protein